MANWMTPEKLEKERVKEVTTFTADEILNNLWNILNCADDIGNKRKPNDNDYRMMGIMVDILYSKINLARRINRFHGSKP